MKVKTHRGAAKRFKKTSTGKFKRASANKSHILTKKEPKRKRRLKKSKIFTPADAPRIKRMLPYD